MKRSNSIPSWAEWLAGGPGIALALSWGFAEGTLFFLLPDLLLSLVAIFRPRRALLHILAIVAGALLAGGVMFTWSMHSPGARTAVARVPFVSAAMFEHADRDFRRFGLWAASKGPLSGIPYKVYAVEAPVHSALWPFLLVSVPARLWRLLLVWAGFAATGMLLRRWQRLGLAPGLHAGFWILVYAVYWSKV